MAGLNSINQAPAIEAEAAFFRCCGCAGWAAALARARPFRSAETLLEKAEQEWANASREDMLEAFSHHPRIGDRDSLRERFPGTHAWSASEQAGVAAADEKALDDLAEANREYEARFGHIFIVCASGKTAPEMLALLRARLSNNPETELKLATQEQMKITRLRLQKLLSQDDLKA